MNEQELDLLARAVADRLAGPRTPGVTRPTNRPTVQPSPVLTRPSAVVRGEPSRALRISDYIDHTLLKPEATRADIVKLCVEAKEHLFAAVCVNGCWARLCVGLLQGSGVKVAAVAGFPLGAASSTAKASEARQLVVDGVDEIDMVAPIGHLIDEDWDYAEDDIRAVVQAARGRTVKVILETAVLDTGRIIKAAAIAREAGAHFVKTSTGFHPAGGATVDAVTLLRAAVGPDLGVKAAGGIRDCATALAMIAAGANRLGTSSGVGLVECLGNDCKTADELPAAAGSHSERCKTRTISTEPY